MRSRLKVILLLFVILTTGVFPQNAAALYNEIGPQPEDVTPSIDRTDYPALFVQEPAMHGDAVWMVQARLKELGYDVQTTGYYDGITSAAVRLFQVANGLEATGAVSEEVWNNLFYGPDGEPNLPTDSGTPDKKRLYLEIDVAVRTIKLIEEGQVIAKYPVAVGTSETPTPLGEWRVVQKCLNWGNGFGTRWMGLNVPWGIFGIHGTDKPYSIGSYASHGCIRMFNRDVEKLYPQVPLGITVRIVENGKMFPKNLRPVKLKKNSFGQQVVYVQSRLKELGIELDRADGRFGNMTELAIKYYQIWHGLKVTGEMDEETYRAMGMIK
ncbi:MAG: peptidoglycan-binding protein [Syntrophomonas sp.]